MTQIVDVNDPGVSHNAWYYIVAPASGAQTVSCTTSGNFDMAALTYSGVDQSNPIDTMSGQLYQTASGSVSNNGTITVTGTTSSPGDWTVVGANYGVSHGVAPSTGSTERAKDYAYDSNGPITPAGAHSMSLLNNSGYTEAMLAIMIALRVAPIAFDTTATTTGTNPSLTITRGTSNANYVGLVFLQNGNTNTESGCTWGGNAMTQIVDVNDPGVSHNAWYYMVAPSSGAQTVSCTTSGNFDMAALTYSGVDQSNPIDTMSGQLYATASATVNNGGTLTVTGTTTTAGDWTVVGANYGVSHGVAASTGSTERAKDYAYDSNGPITPAGAHSMSLLNNSGYTEAMLEIMIALKLAQ
jgi:hypothetical protein